MKWFLKLRKKEKEAVFSTEEQETLWTTYLDVRKSQLEWERAHLMFQEATGQDQIDYAIYVLEAAERKYQMNLKQAKTLKLNGARIHQQAMKYENG